MVFKHNLPWKANSLTHNLRKRNIIMKAFFKGIYDDVERVSTIHGWQRLLHRSSKKSERLLWSISFLLASLIFLGVTSKIIYIYRHHPLKTFIAEQRHPVSRIPFPDVTICNQNHFNWQRLEEAKSRFLFAKHRTPHHEQLFTAVVNAYDTLEFGKFDNFQNISFLYPPVLLLDLNYLNFTEVTEFMTWKCNEMFSECSWMDQRFDCCEIFSARRSQMGLCMAFNSIETPKGLLMQSTDPYYPWRTAGSGPINGLNLRIQVNEALHSSKNNGFKGIKFMTVEPHVWAFESHNIAANSRAYVGITAFQHIYDDTTRVFPPNVRQCIFEGEFDNQFYKSLPTHKYMFENCQSECQQENMMKFCNCTVDLFYPPGPYRACKLADLPCLYKHNEILQNFEYGEREFVSDHTTTMDDCSCYFNCNSLHYRLDIHVDHLATNEMGGNSTEVEMSVFFVWENILVYKTTAVYTVLDLMASLGGLAGLCIGCSLVGVTELLYLLFIDVPKQAILCCKTPTIPNRRKRILRARQIFVKEMSLR